MIKVALALSPHLDDAAFSAGGTLAGLASAGWRVVVATAFAGAVANPTGFALACQLDKGLGPEIDYMALRCDEDTAACAVLGVEPRWLWFREAPHRGYASAPELFCRVREDDATGAALRLALAALIEELAPALLLAPQAIGAHVDHVLLARELLELAAAVPTLWWRDFPYASRGLAPAQPFADAMAALARYTVQLGPDAAARKRTACLAYQSQIGFQFGGAAGLDARLSEMDGIEVFQCAGEVPAALGARAGDAA